MIIFALKIGAKLLGRKSGPPTMPRGRIELDGLDEFNRAVRKSADKELPKRIGQANKRTGQLVISKLPAGPAGAVGTGQGASVRPSATKREVLLRVGGAHRANRASERSSKLRVQQWGRSESGPFVSGERPHIMGAVERHQKEIIKFHMDAIEEAFMGKGPMV